MATKEDVEKVRPTVNEWIRMADIRKLDPKLRLQENTLDKFRPTKTQKLYRWEKKVSPRQYTRYTSWSTSSSYPFEGSTRRHVRTLAKPVHTAFSVKEIRREIKRHNLQDLEALKEYGASTEVVLKPFGANPPIIIPIKKRTKYLYPKHDKKVK